MGVRAWYDAYMTNNTPYELLDLAMIADADYFKTDIRDADTLAAYLADFDTNELADALRDDIADLLSNGNLSDLLPFAETLTEAMHEALTADLLDYTTADTFSDMIANLITARLS